MRKISTGRTSFSNPVRISDREDKSIGGRSDARKTQFYKSKGQSQVDNSLIPRPRIRSSSSECTSIRRSNFAKTPLSQRHHSASRISSTTPSTPRASSSRVYAEPSSGTRHRSPSAERASGFGGKGPRKDARPINDKAYQSTMLSKIDQYFVGIGKISLLNPGGSVKPITLKIFIETTGCLLRLLDIKHDITINNYMEDLPKIAKKIHYPGTVTKSWLKTANTMHSWPQVLAWLSWLVDVCESKDLAARTFEIEKLPFVETSSQETNNQNVFLAMLKIYKAWNEDHPEEEAALTDQYIQDFANKHGDLEKNMAEALVNLQNEKASFHDMSEKSNKIDDEISDLEMILDSLKEEERQETECIESTEDSIQRVVRETQQLDAESKTFEKKIQEDFIRRDQLSILVENQQMSIEERDNILRQCSQIQECMFQLDNHVKDIEKELYAMDLKFAASNKNLYKAILSYNKDIIINMSSNPGADLDELKMPEANILTDNFVEILRDKEIALLNAKENVSKQLARTENLTDASTSEFESLKEKLRTLREENESHVEMITEKKISIQQIQRKAKETEAKLKEQIKNIQNDIVKLQRSMPDLESAMNELSESRDKYEAIVQKRQFYEKSAERFFNKFYYTIAKYRNDMSNLLKKLPEPDL